MSEKRYVRRQRRRFALRFGQGEATTLGFTEDISQEGMFIRTTVTFPPGTMLKVTLSFPDDQCITVTGTVMWANKVPPEMAHLEKKAGFGLKIGNFIEGEELYREACIKTLATA
jgi:hypothetical protein